MFGLLVWKEMMIQFPFFFIWEVLEDEGAVKESASWF